jgi:hypothetical protein
LEAKVQDSVILVHGFWGHPQKTWAASSNPQSQESSGKTSQKAFRSIFPFKSKDGEITSSGERSSGVFWPRDFLAVDLPKASVWTYGYNADLVTGWFEASNHNSIMQHRNDLIGALERDIDNSVSGLSSVQPSKNSTNEWKGTVCFHRA